VEPTIPEGSEDVVIVNGEMTVNVKAFCAVCCGAPSSATPNVTFETPAAVGVPVIDAPFRASPGGKLPETMDHV
jgi:hypothetical protein